MLLGPPLDSDCNFVNGWIRLGDPKNMQRVQLHQISYYCRILSFYATFVSQVADNSRSSLHQPIAAVSVVVQRKTILQGILVYLLNRGWKHIALVYDMHTTNLDIPETWYSIPLALHLSKKRQNVPILMTSLGIRSATNFPSFLRPLEDCVDGERPLFNI